MAYESSGPGPFEDAALNTPYRALRMAYDGTGTSLTVTSNGISQSLPIGPGELIPGFVVITSGTLTGIKGYIKN